MHGMHTDPGLHCSGRHMQGWSAGCRTRLQPRPVRCHTQQQVAVGAAVPSRPTPAGRFHSRRRAGQCRRRLLQCLAEKRTCLCHRPVASPAAGDCRPSRAVSWCCPRWKVFASLHLLPCMINIATLYFGVFLCEPQRAQNWVIAFKRIVATHRRVLLSGICCRRGCLLGVVLSLASLRGIVTSRRLLCYGRSVLV